MQLSTHRHRLYGLDIESAFALPGAPEVSRFNGFPDLVITWEPESAWDPSPWRMAHSVVPYPDIGSADDDSACLVWGDELRFVISPARDRIRLISRIAKLEYAPTVVVGFVLGYLLHLRGILCLHGSVLERDGSAFAVLGEGGAGKSTVAASLVKRGAALLSDDLLAISETTPHVRVEPGCAGIRLDSTAAERVVDVARNLPAVPYLNKVLWDFSGLPDLPDTRYRPCPMPLSDIYVLRNHGGAGEVTVGPVLPPADALRYLVAFRYPPGHLQLLSQECLRKLAVVAGSVPLRVIRYVRSWDQLSRLIEKAWP